jgi:hypothetical protein
MQLPLYKALVSIKITEQHATAVVDAMDAHVSDRITQATQPMLDKLDRVKAEIVGQLGAQLGGQISVLETRFNEERSRREQRSTFFRWVVTAAIGFGGLSLTFLKFTGHL